MMVVERMLMTELLVGKYMLLLLFFECLAGFVVSV